MALVEGYSLRHEGGAEPQDIRATHELAKRHNQSSSDKISSGSKFLLRIHRYPKHKIKGYGA